VGRVITAVVLAAGGSTRFGSPKQAILLDPVLERVRASSSVGDVVVVLGAHEVATDARTVRCPDWQLGPGASLRCGLAALDDDVEAAVVVLGDGPQLDPRSVDRVVTAWRASSAPRVAATYGGVRLHPLLLARAAWQDVPDEGLRDLSAELITCDDLTAPGDVDVPDDYQQEGWPPCKPE
jgi:CTP:molybdopterin cytidylyltransferase MocA